jgi:REP element-mobilizing transposase RayT
MHVVLKSSKAKEKYSFYRHKKFIKRLLNKQSKQHFVKIYQWQNVGNHLHLVLRCKNKDHFNNFLRAVSGLIPRHILKAQRGSAKGMKFWDQRPFTRIIRWAKDYRQMLWYMRKNDYQAKGYDLEHAQYLVLIDKLWRKLVTALE